jgi:hypothetical protein
VLRGFPGPGGPRAKSSVSTGRRSAAEPSLNRSRGAPYLCWTPCSPTTPSPGCTGVGNGLPRALNNAATAALIAAAAAGKDLIDDEGHDAKLKAAKRSRSALHGQRPQTN